LELCSQKEIDISMSFIGKYIYDDQIIEQFNGIKTIANRFIVDRASWTKHTLTSLIISSPPGQGKTEIIKQIISEIKMIAKKNNKKCESFMFTIMTDIVNEKQLLKKLKSVCENKEKFCGIRVIVFDEIDKAQFDFYAPFLSTLESEVKNEEPIIFWIFAQSSYETFKMIEHFATSSSNASLRDFLTRIKLGHIDIPELKVTAKQKVYTALGYALNKNAKLEGISKKCLCYLAFNDTCKNNRDLIADFTKNIIVKDNFLAMKHKDDCRYIAVKRIRNE
jgi:hypothetical protein